MNPVSTWFCFTAEKGSFFLVIFPVAQILLLFSSIYEWSKSHGMEFKSHLFQHIRGPGSDFFPVQTQMLYKFSEQKSLRGGITLAGPRNKNTWNITFCMSLLNCCGLFLSYRGIKVFKLDGFLSFSKDIYLLSKAYNPYCIIKNKQYQKWSRFLNLLQVNYQIVWS